jgi:hypothetical protein
MPNVSGTDDIVPRYREGIAFRNSLLGFMPEGRVPETPPNRSPASIVRPCMARGHGYGKRSPGYRFHDTGPDAKCCVS